MRRWQVKKNVEKDWSDAGPDLLRTRPNAKRTIKDDLADYGGGWYVRLNPPGDKPAGSWEGPHDRSDVLDAFDGWNPKHGTIAQIGRKQKDGSGFDAKTAIKAHVIEVKTYASATDHANTVAALLEAAHPSGGYAGIYVCKDIGSGSTPSQHAFGAAYDHSHGDTEAYTEWSLRMARENRDGDILFPAWQIIGAQKRNGELTVGNASESSWLGGFEWQWGGADSSHLWHEHVSAGKSKKTGTPACMRSIPNEEDPELSTEGAEAEAEAEGPPP